MVDYLFEVVPNKFEILATCYYLCDGYTSPKPPPIDSKKVAIVYLGDDSVADLQKVISEGTTAIVERTTEKLEIDPVTRTFLEKNILEVIRDNSGGIKFLTLLPEILQRLVNARLGTPIALVSRDIDRKPLPEMINPEMILSVAEDLGYKILTYEGPNNREKLFLYCPISRK